MTQETIRIIAVAVSGPLLAGAIALLTNVLLDWMAERELAAVMAEGAIDYESVVIS